MTDIKKYWEKLESSSEKPFYLNEVLELDKNDFFSTNDNIIKANNLIDGLYGGNFILIKNAINEKYLNDLKEKLVNFSKTEPSSFHKMLEGCPNFHREIDEDASKKYSVKSVRHSYYFFRWNKDLFNLLDLTKIKGVDISYVFKKNLDDEFKIHYQYGLNNNQSKYLVSFLNSEYPPEKLYIPTNSIKDLKQKAKKGDKIATEWLRSTGFKF